MERSGKKTNKSTWGLWDLQIVKFSAPRQFSASKQQQSCFQYLKGRRLCFEPWKSVLFHLVRVYFYLNSLAFIFRRESDILLLPASICALLCPVKSSWLEKENVTNTPTRLFIHWQSSRPFAKALAVLRLFPGSHWLGEAIWLCFSPSGFCSEFLKGLLLSSISAAAGALGFSEATLARHFGSLSCPRLLPAACFRALKGGSAGRPRMLCSGCHSPSFEAPW